MKGDILEIKNALSQQSVSRGALPPANNHLEGYLNNDVPLKEMERKMITNALERFHGNRRLAARVLMISERTLYRKIKEYGL
jgi:DNA-binding NtrC family response regulator